MNDMNYYIDRQSGAMRETIAARKMLCHEFVEIYNEVKPDRIYLVGSGTSGNAVRASAAFVQQKLGVETTAISPSSIPTIFAQRPLFVFVSQGGYSTNILRAIEQTKPFAAIALTGEKECRVNEMCARHSTLCCEHEDAGPKTMGYTCTVLTLYLMALEAALAASKISEKDYGDTICVLEGCAGAMDANVQVVRKWYASAEAALLLANSYMVVGVATSCFVAQEAALKLQETVLRPSIGFEFEEYLHGPTSMLTQNTAGMYLMPAQNSTEYVRMAKLAEIHSEIAAPVVIVSAGKKAQFTPNALILQAGDEEYIAPFWQIIPSQVISASMPSKLGNGTKSREQFKKIDEAVGIKYGGIL